MTTASRNDLFCLPPPAPDFRKRCKALRPDEADLGSKLRAMGSAALGVIQLEQDGAHATYPLRLPDRFGDNGMISVVICERGADAWEIDTWLMSCRVVGRRVEEAVLAEVACDAPEAGASTLIGSFLPSGRNGIVEEHYPKLGFQKIEESDGKTRWSMEVDAVPGDGFPMRRSRV